MAKAFLIQPDLPPDPVQRSDPPMVRPPALPNALGLRVVVVVAAVVGVRMLGDDSSCIGVRRLTTPRLLAAAAACAAASTAGRAQPPPTCSDSDALRVSRAFCREANTGDDGRISSLVAPRLLTPSRLRSRKQRNDTHYYILYL